MWPWSVNLIQVPRLSPPSSAKLDKGRRPGWGLSRTQKAWGSKVAEEDERTNPLDPSPVAGKNQTGGWGERGAPHPDNSLRPLLGFARLALPPGSRSDPKSGGQVLLRWFRGIGCLLDGRRAAREGKPAATGTWSSGVPPTLPALSPGHRS